MYSAKIPGTKYLASLESVRGQWCVRLKLDDVVEAEEDVPQLNKRTIHSSLGNLFRKVNLPINSFQHDLITNEITDQISHLTSPTQSEGAKEWVSDAPKEDPRVDELLAKLDVLESHLKTLEERIERIEALKSS